MFGAAGVGIGVGLATVSAAPWYFRLARTKWGISAADILGALAAPVAGAIFMRVVLMTSRLAGLDRFPQLAELPLLITVGLAVSPISDLSHCSANAPSSATWRL
jgi:hypothetical protein